MADLAAAYGRSEAQAFERGGIDPRASSPTPADMVFSPGRWRTSGRGPGGRWNFTAATWAKSPPEALRQDPHIIWDTPVQSRDDCIPYIRSVIGVYDPVRSYGRGDIVALPPSKSALSRSLRDDNVGHDPGTAIVQFGTTATAASFNYQNPDWWQPIPLEWGGNHLPYTSGTGHANLNVPGVSNLQGNYAALHGAWMESPVEAETLVGADQWAAGECQANGIGPFVRCDPSARTYYRVTSGYEISPDFGFPSPVAMQNATIMLHKVVNGTHTLLKMWQHIWEGWCYKLAVHTDQQGHAVLRVWWRVWGYDPFERDLDIYPWNYLGEYVDTDAPILIGQPGYSPYRGGMIDEMLPLDGMYWWGWGEMGGPVADTSAYMVSGASRLSAPVVTDAGDLAFSAPAYLVDDGASDSVSITDSNSVSIISPASASATDTTSSADASTCRLIVTASVAVPFLLSVSLAVAVLYDTATADTGSFADAVAISQPTRQSDTSTAADLSVIALVVPVADASSSLDAASASVGRFSATTDATTTADSETDTLELRSSGADASSQSDATGCELIFPATIDVSDTTSIADGTAIIAAIGQSDASAQSDIAYGYLGQFASASDTTSSIDGVGTSITTGVWVPPAKAPRIKLALGGPVIRLRSAAPEIDVSHAGGPLIRLSLLEER